MLSKWQVLFLIIMTLPIMGHVIILPLTLDVAGRDILLSVLLSLPVALLFAYVIYRIRVNHPELFIAEVLFVLLGKWGGGLVRFVFILYFLFLTVISFGFLIDFVNISFLRETPKVILIIWFLPFFLYAASKGIKQIALTAGILAFVSVIGGNTVSLMDFKLKDWSELLPFLEFGWSPVLWGSLIFTSVWIELLFILFIPIKNMREKHLFLFLTIGILLNGFMMMSAASGVITIFGLGQASNFTYPTQEIVRTIDLALLDRFDIYGMLLMTFGNYIRCSLYFRIAYELSQPKNVSKLAKRVLFSILALFIFSGTFYLAKEHYRLEEVVTIYAYMIVLIPVPFVLWFISRLKNKYS